MRALVTGCAGFVGRHMVRELRHRGYEVYGADILATDGHPEWHIDAHKIFDGEAYENIRFNLIVHCAYHIGGRQGIDGVNMSLAKNLSLDASMFEWAVRTGQGKVLYFSSSAAYPTSLQTLEAKQRLSENHIDLDNIRQPDSNYGLAKIVGERLARTAITMGIPVNVVRPFSGYGSDQGDEYPFTAIVKRASTGDVSVWGMPGQTRDWIHIDDVVSGALTIVDNNEYRPVNLCTGEGTEMGEFALSVAYKCGYTNISDKQAKYLIDKPTGPMWRVGNPTRMLQHYYPKITFQDGIQRKLKAMLLDDSNEARKSSTQREGENG